MRESGRYSRKRWTLLFGTFLPMLAVAQVIQVKTIPVSTGDQFLLYPSDNLGMGGVSIATGDLCLDPFVNPAKGSRIKKTLLFGSPTYYAITRDCGSAASFPFGFLTRSSRYFGGMHISLQQMDAKPPFVEDDDGDLYEESNLYTYSTFGIGLPRIGSSLGLGLFYAKLSAIDGVDQLYAGRRIRQNGMMADIRIGYLKEWANHGTLEVLLLHNRSSMRHIFTYNEEKDQTVTWGMHLGYVSPLNQSGWRTGTIFTVNWKTHPKIPNYTLMNIPRDPGNTAAFNIGMGVSNADEEGKFALDLIFEPVWTDTWAEAESWEENARDGISVDNKFRFMNFLCRAGFTEHHGAVDIQFGVQAKAIRYVLTQHDYIEESRRKQEEHWIEWTGTFGCHVNFSSLRIQYVLRLVFGTGQPGVETGSPVWTGESAAAWDFIPAPSGALTNQKVIVHTHRITLIVPLNHG